MKIPFLLVVFGVVHNSLSQFPSFPNLNALPNVVPNVLPNVIPNVVPVVPNVIPTLPPNLVIPGIDDLTSGVDKLTNLVDINSLLDLYGSTDKIGKGKDTTIDFLRREGYPHENHYVRTPDGYILNLHRIPAGKTGKSNNKVAYLQHGLLASSSDWVLAGPGKGLAYILADEGYDVWMGNGRGNKYSRNHTRLNPDIDSEFWKFSWHEIGAIDLPTMIDYVLSQTGVDGVYYSGHSQGTTSFFVMGAVVPEYNNKIKAQVSLAPIAYMSHMTSPLMHIVASVEDQIGAVAGFIGKDEFLPSDGFLAFVSENLCAKGIGQLLCKNSLFAVCGFSHIQMNLTLLPIIMEQTPAGASTRQLLHYAQEINSGRFCHYDQGFLRNPLTYLSGTSTKPPDYDLSKVTAPVYLIYSKNDWLAGEKDVNRLCAELGNCVEKLKVPDDGFNHLDFTFGIGAPTLVYKEVVKLFARH